MSYLYKNEFEDIYKWIRPDSDLPMGYVYAQRLFRCVLLYYYDKFGNLNRLVVRRLFVWAFSIRTDMDSLRWSTINKYAIGEHNRKYSNNIPMFSIIRRARHHTEIGNIVIKYDCGKPKRKRTTDKQSELLSLFKTFMGKDDINGD